MYNVHSFLAVYSVNLPSTLNTDRPKCRDISVNTIKRMLKKKNQPYNIINIPSIT